MSVFYPLSFLHLLSPPVRPVRFRRNRSKRKLTPDMGIVGLALNKNKHSYMKRQRALREPGPEILQVVIM
jgi:hypothetical protein